MYPYDDSKWFSKVYYHTQEIYILLGLTTKWENTCVVLHCNDLYIYR